MGKSARRSLPTEIDPSSPTSPYEYYESQQKLLTNELTTAKTTIEASSLSTLRTEWPTENHSVSVSSSPFTQSQSQTQEFR
jgi:hypothetical protein